MARRTKVAEVPLEVLSEQAVEKDAPPDLGKKSVVDFPDAKENATPRSFLLLQVASAADDFVAWGQDVKGRDKQLREFFPTEPFLASAVYSTSIRNASFAWDVVPADPTAPKPRNTILAVNRLLRASDRGNGWSSLITKTSIDLYTQDNGAFWEIIRSRNSPTAPVLNIAHLDSQRCYRTGDPTVPVVYEDRWGRLHPLNWYQVVTIEEFPSPVESMYGVQLCAVSRALRAVQILRDIEIFKHEKVSGRFARAIDFVSGVTNTELEDAKRLASESANNMALARYSEPIMLTGIDPTNPVTHVRVDLASLPDGFDEETTHKWYLAILAMAFGVDYQEFAPLPGGSLGSGQQSEILHLKTRGKGPATVMTLFEHIINDNRLIPATVRLQYKLHDARAAEEQANARFLRGKDRALRVQSGELDLKAAIEMAFVDGDLPEYLAEALQGRLQSQPPPEPTVPDSQQVTDEQIDGGRESHIERRDFSGEVDPFTEEEIWQERERLISLWQEEADALDNTLAAASG